MDFINTGHFKDLMAKLNRFLDDVTRIASALERIAESHEREEERS